MRREELGPRPRDGPPSRHWRPYRTTFLRRYRITNPTTSVLYKFTKWSANDSWLRKNLIIASRVVGAAYSHTRQLQGKKKVSPQGTAAGPFSSTDRAPTAHPGVRGLKRDTARSVPLIEFQFGFEDDADVCFWPKADIPIALTSVRFRG